ncbi:MAG TPA: hypothetical protein VFJ16_10360 [Longimicrobium sp.]|nr:hypothetical protein [Longimicrobium sp.]
MRRIIPMGFLLAAALGGCGDGGERVSIRGDFADTAAVPTSVFAVEAGREAEVKRGAFDLRDLSAGPVTLRLVRGVDTVGSVMLQNVPAGTRLQLHALRTDGATRRAFPRALALEGPPVLLVNGIRMAGGDAVPAQVDARGTVLSASEDGAALLVRPADPALPDLRVVVGLGTETVAPDSSRVEPAGITGGDSVRVEGRTDGGFVVASRLTVWRRGRTGGASAAASTPEGRADSRDDSEPERTASAAPSPTPPSPTPPPVRTAARVPVRVPREVRQRIDRIEHGRGGGKGRGNGGGRGHGKKG